MVAGSFKNVRIQITPYNDTLTGDTEQTLDFMVFNPTSDMVRLYLLAIADAPEGDPTLLDVNHDGKTDIADMIMLINNGL